MIYKTVYRNSNFCVKISTNVKTLLKTIDNFLDFDDRKFCNKFCLNIKIYLRKVKYKIKDNDRNYIYKNRIRKDDSLNTLMGNKLGEVFVNPNAGEIRGYIYDYTRIPRERFLYFFFFQPLRHILAKMGIFFLHAAAVSKGGQGILIIGAQDCGKTTLAITLSRDGGYFLSDDKCFIKTSKNKILILPFPTKIGIHDKQLGRYRKFKKYILKNYRFGEKKRISGKHITNIRDISGVEFKTLIFPKYKEGKDIEIKPLSKKNALYRLVKEHLCIPDRELFIKTYINNFKIFSNLVNQADSFELVYNDGELNKINQIFPL